MKTLYVMDPLDIINVEGDSTYMLMLEANKRGWPTYFCTPSDLYVENGKAKGKINRVYVSDESPYFQKRPPEILGLGEFHVIWMRKDPPFDMDYVFTTYLLDLVPEKTLVLNDPSAIRNCNEKMYALKWAELCPKTLVTRKIEEARQWSKQYEKVVIKPWDGNGGRGVLVSSFSDPNYRSMLEILMDQEKQYIIVQEYLPAVKKGDKRIILIDGEPSGWMARIPQPGDHRGNMHVGARVSAFDLTDRDRFICDQLRKSLKELKLLFVGIDIIGDCLTEINVTSPTGIIEINDLMSVQLEKTLTEQIIRYYKNHTGVTHD
jgi:glutathione synthase